MDGTRLYLDTASAAPVRREALEAAWPYLAGAFGNPSSHHEIGRISSEALADARSRVAKVLGMRSTDITFTSGGTEADNLAIIGMALGAREIGRASCREGGGESVVAAAGRTTVEGSEAGDDDAKGASRHGE